MKSHNESMETFDNDQILMMKIFEFSYVKPYCCMLSFNVIP